MKWRGVAVGNSSPQVRAILMAKGQSGREVNIQGKGSALTLRATKSERK